MVQVRIKFDADLIIEAENLAEARIKFEGLPLFTEVAKACNVEYGETLFIEDANTYDDLSHDWYKT